MEQKGAAAGDKLQFILDKSHDFITLIDRNYRYEVVNDAYCWAMEKSREEILGATAAEVWGQDRFVNSIREKLDRCFTGEEVHFMECFTFGPFQRNMRVSMYPYPTEADVPSHVAVFSYDVTRISEIESKLADYEYRDPVTGLFNRRSLDVILDMEIEKAKRSSGDGLRALLCVSLRNLGQVIQTYGHHVADLILENTAIRIKKVLRGTDYVFRFEGTELVVLLGGVRQNTDAAPTAQKIQDEVSVPYRHGNIDVAISCAIGVSVYPDDGADKDTLIQNAISARVEAETQGQRFLLYNQELHKRALARMELATGLQRAFENARFVVHYHPIVDMDGAIVGAEALLRWFRSDGSLVPPDTFIPLAEKNGLIVSIDKWVLYHVCKQVRRWSEDNDLYVTLNFSASTFGDRSLVEVVQGALRNADDLDPARIKIEITESQCMRDPEAAVRQMQLLRDMGVEVWIDDFGTGHSSLSYLRKLPARMMKIDKEFIDELADSPEDMVYLANIINSVRSRRKDIVVEGIESARQHDLLTRLGCSFMQGYYYSKPVSPQSFGALLEGGGSLLSATS